MIAMLRKLARKSVKCIPLISRNLPKGATSKLSPSNLYNCILCYLVSLRAGGLRYFFSANQPEMGGVLKKKKEGGTTDQREASTRNFINGVSKYHHSSEWKSLSLLDKAQCLLMYLMFVVLSLLAILLLVGLCLDIAGRLK
jgi:hypothetical protein